MATKLYEFEGVAKWAKVYDPDEYKGEYKWQLNFYFDDAKEFELYKRSGAQGKLRDDEDGTYVIFRRDQSKEFGKDFIEFTPPFIFDKDGKPLVKYMDTETGDKVYSFNVKDGVKYERKGERVFIGNGSRLRVRISVYDTSMGKGSRLENIKIVDLIEGSGSSRDVITSENMPPDMGDNEGEPVKPASDFADMDTDPREAESKPVGKKKTPQKDMPW